MALSNFAEFITEQGEYALARSLLEEVLSTFRELGNESGVGWSLNHLGDVAFAERDFVKASSCYHQGYEVFRSVGDQWGIARSFTDLGRLASEQNDQRGARALFEQGLTIFIELGHTRGVARVFEGLACVAVREGDFPQDLTLCAAAEGLRQRVGAPKRPVEQARLDTALQPAWRDINPATASAIWAAGLRMSLEEAIRYALNAPQSGRLISERS